MTGIATKAVIALVGNVLAGIQLWGGDLWVDGYYRFPGIPTQFSTVLSNL